MQRTIFVPKYVIGWLQQDANPQIVIPESWDGDMLDMLEGTWLSDRDKIWVCLQCDVLYPKTVREFSLDCFSQVLAEIQSPDPRVKAAFELATKLVDSEVDQRLIKNKLNAAYKHWQKIDSFVQTSLNKEQFLESLRKGEDQTEFRNTERKKLAAFIAWKILDGHVYDAAWKISWRVAAKDLTRQERKRQVDWFINYCKN